MPNMASIIASHNRNILNTQHSTQTLWYTKQLSSLVTRNQNTLDWRQQHSNPDTTTTSHHSRTVTQESSTGLSKHVWDLQIDNKPFEIKWSIASLATPYQKEPNECQLCLTEKTLIIFAEKNSALNKRQEMMSKCRHKKNMLLVNIVG